MQSSGLPAERAAVGQSQLSDLSDQSDSSDPPNATDSSDASDTPPEYRSNPNEERTCTINDGGRSRPAFRGRGAGRPRCTQPAAGRTAAARTAASWRQLQARVYHRGEGWLPLYHL